MHPLGIQADHNRRTNWKVLFQSAMRDQKPHCTVFHHVSEAISRKCGIEWHVSAAGLSNAEQGNQHVDGTFQTQANEDVFDYSETAEMERKQIGTTDSVPHSSSSSFVIPPPWLQATQADRLANISIMLRFGTARSV